MENLSFLLKLCLHVRVSLEGGESLRLSLSRFLSSSPTRNHVLLREWLNYYDQTGGECCAHELFKNQRIEVFLSTIAQGLRGYSIYERVKAIEEEFIELCQEEFQRHIDKLPYQLMLPLLFFMFPAYLLLLLGPILNLLIQNM